MPGAVLLCCSLDAEVYLAPALVELGRAGQTVDVVSGVEEDFIPLGRALDALDESGIVIFVRDPSLSTEVVRRIEGVFSARHKPGQTFVAMQLDPGESPQQLARRMLEAVRDPQAAARRRTERGPAPFEPPHGGSPSEAPPPAATTTPAVPAAASPSSAGASSAAAAELEAALATMEAALAGAPDGPIPPDGVGAASTGDRTRPPRPAGSKERAAPPRSAGPSPASAKAAPSGPTPPEAALEPAARTAVGSLLLVAVLGVGLVGAGVLLVRRSPSEPSPAADATSQLDAAGAELAAGALPAAERGASGQGASPRPAPAEAAGAAEPPELRLPSEGPSGGPSAPGAGASAPAEDSPGDEADMDYATREALVVARAVAKGRLRAIDDLVVGVVDPSPRPYGQAREACKGALVAGVGNFDLATAAELRLVRRARMIPSGSYWSRTPGRRPGTRQVLHTSEVALADVPESDAAGIVCVRPFPRPE